MIVVVCVTLLFRYRTTRWRRRRPRWRRRRRRRRYFRTKKAIIHFLFICWTFHVLSSSRFARSFAQLSHTRSASCALLLVVCPFHVGINRIRNGNGNAFSTSLAYAHSLVAIAYSNSNTMLNANGFACIRSLTRWYCACILSRHTTYCFVASQSIFILFFWAVWRFTISMMTLLLLVQYLLNAQMSVSRIQLFTYQPKFKNDWSFTLVAFFELSIRFHCCIEYLNIITTH